MLRVFSFSTLAVCAALLVMASSALAGTIPVDYYTTGSFSMGTNANSPTFPSTSTSSSVKIGELTFTYNFEGSSGTPIDINLPSNGSPLTGLQLGNFTFSSTSTNSQTDSFGGINFAIDVYQTVPSGGPGQLAAVLSGALAESGSITRDSLQVTYSPSTVVVNSSPAISYTITDTYAFSTGGTHIGENLSGNTQPVQIGAEASVVVPLPNTSITELALLAGIAGFAAIRRRALA